MKEMADPTECTDTPMEEVNTAYCDDLFGDIDFSATFDEEFEMNFQRDYHTLIPDVSLKPEAPAAQPLEQPVQQQPVQPVVETYEQRAQFVQPQQIYVQPVPQPSIAFPYNYNYSWTNNSAPAFASPLVPTLVPTLAPTVAPTIAPTVVHSLQTNGQQISYPHASPASHQPVYQPQLYAIPREPYAQGEVHSDSSSRLPSVSPLRRVSEESKFPPSPESIGTDTPRPKRPARNHHGEPLLNDKIPRKTHRKKLAGQNIEPERYYGPPPIKPRSWGPKSLKGEYLFTYTEKGELAPGKYFTAQEMRKYLMGPSPGERWERPTRMPGVRAIKGKYRQGLTLWVGWPAAMANSRYPRGGESTKCRFADCLYSQHTISVGQPWVIFDERQNKEGEVYDPFHNAGYCHLYCLESNFDIVELWQRVDIRADNRTFKREQYEYFNLSKKLPGIDKVYQQWWRNAMEELQEIHLQNPKGRRNRTRENSLDACLVEYKLLMEGRGQAKTRQKRNGIDISKHRGDPELKRKLQTFKKYHLLDEFGNPCPDAEEQLEAIENERKRQKKETRVAAATASWQRYASEPSPQGLFDPRYQTLPGQQQQSAHYITTSNPHIDEFSPSYPSQQQPLQYEYAAQFTPTIEPHIQHPYPPHPQQGYAAETICVQQPVQQEPAITAEEAVTGHKRNLDEVVVEDANISGTYVYPVGIANTGVVVTDLSNQGEPSPKRERLDAIPASSLEPQLPEADIPVTTFDSGANAVLDAVLDDADMETALEEFFDLEGADGKLAGQDATDNSLGSESFAPIDVEIKQDERDKPVIPSPGTPAPEDVKARAAIEITVEPVPTPASTPIPLCQEGEGVGVGQDSESLFGSSGGSGRDGNEDGGSLQPTPLAPTPPSSASPTIKCEPPSPLLEIYF